MIRTFGLAALLAATAGLALAQAPHFSAEPEPGRIYAPMNLMPPGMTGRIYNDGTTEAPPPAQVENRAGSREEK